MNPREEDKSTWCAPGKCSYCDGWRKAAAEKAATEAAVSDLKISKDRVLEAAGQCGDAKRILKTLFPEVFADNVVVPVLDDKATILPIKYEGLIAIQLRNSSTDLNKRSLWLDSRFQWTLETDDGGTVLVARRVS